MTTSSTTRSTLPIADPRVDAVLTKAPMNEEERILRMQALGRRVDAHIQFMCAARSLPGSSSEGIDKALAAFYEQLVILEQRLARIHENLQLE